jgi:hypothetical protein
MNSNVFVVVVAVVGIIVPMTTAILNFIQARAAAKAVAAAAVKVETVRTDLQEQGAQVSVKLDTIHTLVNSRLTAALTMIGDLSAVLRQIAPNDPRVQALTDKAKSN